MAQARPSATQAVHIGSGTASLSNKLQQRIHLHITGSYFTMTTDGHHILVLLILLVECLCALPSLGGATELTTTTTPARTSMTFKNVQRKQTREEGSRGMIVTYWGQYDEPSLQHACQSGNYGIIILSFLSSFGHNKKPKLDLAGHCDAGSGGCTHLSTDIESCQRMGVKILLSLGGASGNYGLDSDRDAEATALHIWNSYLGGRSHANRRPLEPAVLDGVDFDVEKGNPKHYATLATSLKKLMRKGKKRFILGAAPQCPFSDEWMGPRDGTALSTVVFDYVWVQFYNNEQCHYDPKTKSPARVLKSWRRWTSALPRSKILLGLPASLDGSTDEDDAKAGFMPIRVLVDEVLPVIKKSRNYGGVMLWSYFYDLHSHETHHGKNRVFSTAIARSV